MSFGRRKVVLHNWALLTILSKIKDKSFGKFCARSLVFGQGQSSPKLSFSGSRSCVSAQSAPGPFVEVAGSSLPELVKEAFSDPVFQRQVRGLEAMLCVRERSCWKPSCCLQEDAHGDCASTVGSASAHSSSQVCRLSSVGLETVQTTAGKSKGNPSSLEVIASDFSKFCDGTSASGRPAHAIACMNQRFFGLSEDIEYDSSKHHVQNHDFLRASEGENDGITGLLEVREPHFRMRSDASVAAATSGQVVSSSLHATASESVGIRGSRVSGSSLCMSTNSSNSSGCVVGVACARSPAVLGVSASASSFASASASFAVVAHARSTPKHDAHNSWSDTGRVQGPTGRRCTNGGVSGPAEDLRPVSEVEAGVNFRPAGGVRGQVAGSLLRRQPGTGTRLVKGSVVTPSLRPEVPDTRFASPGRRLRIRQSMGWTKVCSTAKSGIWVLKGNARACKLPENLDHLRVEWISRGSYKTAWVTPGHDCLYPYQYGRGAAVRPQTNDAIWDGVIGLWGRVAPLLSPWCARGDVPTGVNLNRYSGSGSLIRWHSDNEPLFGPQNLPKLIVSVSLRNSVEFMVRRRASRNVPSSIRLDHGDILVMDG